DLTAQRNSFKALKDEIGVAVNQRRADKERALERAKKELNTSETRLKENKQRLVEHYLDQAVELKGYYATQLSEIE
ncbi:hypothetical protein MO867_23235, partial [Microbulbifer sp. OS29]